ncbi:MAG TPA: glycosyltransferase family 1 protein [Chloroflexia bacterium]|nr:glycosyltransferase family 1 protein [Chloroflexia bacterium]
MHLAFDARMVYYRRAGIGQYSLRLLRALADLPAAEVPGLRVTVLQSRKDPEPIILDDPRFRRRGLLTPCHHRFEQAGLAIELAMLRPQPEIIHSPDFIPPFHRPCPAVITVHDLAFLRFPGLLTAESKRYYGQIRRAVASAEAIIAVSASTAADLVSLAGADPRKVHTVYEAADPLYVPPAAPPKLPGHLLFVSTIEPRKNLPVLLEAYRLLLDGGRVQPLPPLWVVGQHGWLHEQSLAAIGRLGLDDHVRLLGGVSPQELLGLYQGARLFAMPSLYEGFGLGALEALACGTPVLAADAGALPEVVGAAGILLPPQDPEAWAAAMERVLLNPTLEADLRSRGPRQAVRFSWQRAARETLAVYTRVLNRASTGQ